MSPLAPHPDVRWDRGGEALPIPIEFNADARAEQPPAAPQPLKLRSFSTSAR